MLPKVRNPNTTGTWTQILAVTDPKASLHRGMALQGSGSAVERLGEAGCLCTGWGWWRLVGSR